MKIEIGPSILCDLLGGHFTLEACEVICELFEENEDSNSAPRIGDIAISFSEIPEEWTDDWNEDNLVAKLDNGNVVIFN